MDERTEKPANEYMNILDLPRHASATRPRMPRQDRAAQFAPFAALSGYGAVIDETARQTEARAPLGEDGASMLDLRIALLLEHLAERPEAEITFFRPDERKAGGAFITHTGAVRRFDEPARTLHFEDGTRVPLMDVMRLEGALFRALETE